MYTFLIAIHIIACLLLMVIILLQAGRAGGLGWGFGAAESIFGAKTNVFLTKFTVILAGAFLISCLGLATLSVHRRRSLMESEMLKGRLQETRDSFSPDTQGQSLPPEEGLDLYQ